MDAKELAKHLTDTLKSSCPGIQHDYPLSFIEYTLYRELDTLVYTPPCNDNEQQKLL